MSGETTLLMILCQPVLESESSQHNGQHAHLDRYLLLLLRLYELAEMHAFSFKFAAMPTRVSGNTC